MLFVKWYYISVIKIDYSSRTKDDWVEILHIFMLIYANLHSQAARTAYLLSGCLNGLPTIWLPERPTCYLAAWTAYLLSAWTAYLLSGCLNGLPTIWLDNSCLYEFGGQSVWRAVVFVRFDTIMAVSALVEVSPTTAHTTRNFDWMVFISNRWNGSVNLLSFLSAFRLHISIQCWVGPITVMAFVFNL